MALTGKRKLLLAAIFSSCVVFMFACRDDGGRNCTTCPGEWDTIPGPTGRDLDNIWPNDDGTSWTYQYRLRNWDSNPFTYYPSEDDVPDMPSMSQLEYMLGNQPIGGNVNITEKFFGLEFDGDITTMSGAHGQNLKDTIYAEGDKVLAGASSEIERVFIARLLMARPDLAEKIAQVYGIEPEVYESVSGYGTMHKNLSDTFDVVMGRPLFLHGYAWEKTRDWIGTYGDLDQLLAWKYLESNLRVSHEFTHQLVPSLASDVFLHCKILRDLVVETEIGTFRGAIEVLYAVDYGIFEGRSVYQPLGYMRAFDYGTIIYAPAIGPVFSYERNLCEAGDPPSNGIGDQTLSVIRSNVAKVPHDK